MHVLQSHRECHHSIADKLELVFERHILPGQLFRCGARPRVLLVVRGARTVGVATLEMVLPELCGMEEMKDFLEFYIILTDKGNRNNRG